MADRLVTVFGGTGFLGRRIVRHLRARDFSVRVASRHPDRAGNLFGAEGGRLQPIATDVHDRNSVARACAGAYGAVNAVSLYVEHGAETFRSVHVEAAERVAAQARHAGVHLLVHISGIGADPISRSPYIRSRGEGEQAVRNVFPGAIIIRPAVMFGPDDNFLTTLLALLRRLPVYPMFGRGRTRLQPAFVEDAAEAIVRCIEEVPPDKTIFECAGPDVYTYAELLKTIAAEAGVRPVLAPLPFSLWHLPGFLGELLPSPPITRNQVELMEVDTIASTELPGCHDLGISPRSIIPVLQSMLRSPGGCREPDQRP
jgi:NADH dehydrogenase